jgi:predicted glycoside hydrolase/deacetylase ChbG (UPF0249 family)
MKTHAATSPTDSLRVIINADDLGACDTVNDRIFSLMAEGAVTSATLMANAPAAGDAIRRACTIDDCSFGVHLNLSDFRPLSAPGPLEPILNEDGEFVRGAIRRVRITAELIRGVSAEFESQIELIKSHGVAVSHLDSHHHVHTVPALFLALKQAQRRHGLQRVRISRNLYEAPIAATTMLKKRLWNTALRVLGRTRTTQTFSDLATFITAATRVSASQIIELSVHPGNPDFADEDRLLETKWWSELPFRIELTNYNDI